MAKIMNNVIDLDEYRETHEQKSLSDVWLRKFSSRRIELAFDKWRKGLSLDRDNFEKMVRNARSIMGWDE
jgi:hypothetical protein